MRTQRSSLSDIADEDAAGPFEPPRTSVLAGRGLDGPLRVSSVDAPQFSTLQAEWRSLCARAAAPNVFMDPAVAHAVSAGASLRILLAWHDVASGGGAPLLVGVWLGALRTTRAGWPFRVFASPTTPVAYLGTPVVDAAHAQAALRALLTALRDDPGLPKLAEIGDLNEALLPALAWALAQEDMQAAMIETRARARLLPAGDPGAVGTNPRSKAHQKNMARKRRGFERLGAVAAATTVEPGAVVAELEEFLALEASGWKGARGSALASDAARLRMVRTMIAGLAGEGLVKIHALRLDGRAVAMSIVLLCGRTAFTWRVAYDEAYRAFSPGIQLLDIVTHDLSTDPRLDVTDSCNHRDTGFQAELWADRHRLHDLLIDVRAGRGGLLRVLAARERWLRALREAARQARRRALDRLAARRKGREPAAGA